MRLKDKISVITGAASGIGKAIADVFSREGAVVIALDINMEELKKTIDTIRSKGLDAFAIKCDMSSLSEIDKTVNKIKSNFKKVDILVNNAGIFSSTPLMEITSNEWDFVMNVNLKGPFFLSKEILKLMTKNRSGKIINIASLAAKRGGTTSAVPYGASKAGIVSVTKYCAKFAAPYGINVNAVVPGFVDTGINPRIKDMIEYIPIRRIAKPEEIANVALFLASDDSSYITGEMIDVDGGFLMD